jgi:hypothetical protein
MIGLAFVVGIYALWHGYKKHHRSFVPVLIFIFGMLCLLAKQHWQEYEFLILPFAVVSIISAHVINFRLCSKQSHSRQHTQEAIA